MTDFLKLPNNKNKTKPDQNFDFIMRYENLNKDFFSLCDMLGLSRRSLPVLNKGNKQPYADYYDPDLIHIVGNLFREDIELFCYEFNTRQRGKI